MLHTPGKCIESPLSCLQLIHEFFGSEVAGKYQLVKRALVGIFFVVVGNGHVFIGIPEDASACGILGRVGRCTEQACKEIFLNVLGIGHLILETNLNEIAFVKDELCLGAAAGGLARRENLESGAVRQVKLYGRCPAGGFGL